MVLDRASALRGRAAKVGSIQGDEAILYIDGQASEIEMMSIAKLCALAH